jgi:hypothetical protein
VDTVQAATEALAGPDAPRGVSFLKVAAPREQPQLVATASAAPLPATVDMPALESVPVPDAQLLADRSGTR